MGKKKNRGTSASKSSNRSPEKNITAPETPVEAPVVQARPTRTIRRKRIEESQLESAETAPNLVVEPVDLSDSETSAQTASVQPVESESASENNTDGEKVSESDERKDETALEAADNTDQSSDAISETHSADTEMEIPFDERDPRLTGLGKAVIAPPPESLPTRSKQSSKVKEFVFDSNDDGSDSRRGKGPAKKTRQKRRRRSDGEMGVQHFDMRMEDVHVPTRRRRRKSGPKMVSPKAKAIKRRIEVNGTISVGALAHGMAVKSSTVIKKLIALGVMATVNEEIDIDTATLIAEEYDFEVIDATFQEEALMIQTEEQTEEEGEIRPPVITIMGHVDHGKTTLLDTIRQANVAAGEAGGITQHTSAYQVNHDGKLLTFIDTPGHEAFTAMRARGAQVTDIVVLVVSADDGMMPQTIEALNHSRAAGVQIIVAINKIDKPNANPEKVKTDLMSHNLIPENYGGDTIVVEISALKKIGISELLDSLLLVAEIGEYRATTDRHAEGTVLEARLEKGRGAVATVLVKQGTLKVGDSLVLGTVSGRVRSMQDHNGKRIKQALPSTPVEIIGLADVPLAGDDFVVVRNDKDARVLVDHRIEEAKRLAAEQRRPVTLEDLLAQKSAGELLTLNLILKSDVNGTLEAMKISLEKINVEGTQIKILHSGVGAISESDVTLAQTYNGIIIGFNIRPDPKARRLINQHEVDVRTYRVIYKALEELEAALKGMLGPTLQEQWKGQAEVRETFSVPRVGTVAGCFVLDGSLSRNHKVRLLRDGSELWEGKMGSLRRFKDDVRSVEKGYECGVGLEGFNDVKVGDIIETFMIEEEAAE